MSAVHTSSIELTPNLVNSLGVFAPVIVTGMHRSGTSLIARILSELGIHIGIDLDVNNESRCFKNVNMRLLQDQGAHWIEPEPFVSRLDNGMFVRENAAKALHLLDRWIGTYGEVENGQLWGWKDPRNILTLPVWLDIFPDAKVIHVVRNGIDVALSLQRREMRRYRYLGRSDTKHMFPPTIVVGYRLWKKYLQIGMELEKRCASWISLRYEDVVSQPQAHVRALCESLGIDVSSETEADIARQIVRRPTGRSRLEAIRVRLLLRTGLIDSSLLIAMGYESPA